MVARPPPSGQAGNEKEGTGSSRSNSIRSAGGPRGLEWSLRSLHKFDSNAEHFLENYYENGNSDSDDSDGDNELEDQSAYDIFKGKDEHSKKDPNSSVWATLYAPLRTGIVDGKKIIFELVTDVTQKPAIRRKERFRRKHIIQNADKSHWEVRIRFWMMHFSVGRLSTIFLGAFIALNAIFTVLFYVTDGHCCGDDSLTFGQVFDFAIQTSSTIGYGGYTPRGMVPNFLVVLLNYSATLMNTIFAGLLFTKFVTPVINIQFSDVMTLCNVNGVPCLSFRLGNADGYSNELTDINVRLTYSYQIPYSDHKGEKKFFRQTEDLKLLSNRKHGLLEAWTLRHVLDESSPLFGLHFQEHPGNKIYVFTLSIDAVQDITKSSVNIQTEYAVEDVMIGHSFISQMSIDMETRVAISDYSKMSDTEPSPVWYPALAGAYGNQHLD